MKQRLTMLALVAGLFTVCAQSGGEDPEWLELWSDAQRHRPAEVGPVARIAEEGERGTPLIVRARVVRSNGRPAANAIVFAYQTDATGVYDRPGERGWRLRGWVRTDKAGRFELHTIRPAPYPNRRVPAHVHLVVEARAGRVHAEVRFADDPFVTAAERERGARDPAYDVRPVTTRRGIQTVDLLLRLPHR